MNNRQKNREKADDKMTINCQSKKGNNRNFGLEMSKKFTSRTIWIIPNEKNKKGPKMDQQFLSTLLRSNL